MRNPDPATILITGGTGFIGSRLAVRCSAAGHDVRVLAQRNTPAEEGNVGVLEERGIELLIGSITDPEAVKTAVQDRDIVIHLAAAQHEMNVPDDHFWKVNVDGTRTLLRHAIFSGVDRFVHGSTIGVYGEPSGVIDECSSCTPDNVYGRTKLEGENVVRSASGEISTVILRIPEVYGPGDRRLLKLFRAVEKGVFFIVGSGENLHHPAYVDDIVSGLISAAHSDEAEGQHFVLAGPEPITTNAMVEAVADAVGSPPPRFRAPMLPFLLAATVLEVTLRPLGIQPPLHRRRLDFFRKSFSLSTQKARAVFGFQPTVTFRDGAKRTAEWYRNAGVL